MEFKYTISQTLALKEAVAQMEREGNTPPRLTVIARILEECHGGIQLVYRCRLVSTGYAGGMMQPELVSLFEFELEPYPPLPAKDNGTPATPEQVVEAAAKTLERLNAKVEMAQLNLADAKKRAGTP